MRQRQPVAAYLSQGFYSQLADIVAVHNTNGRQDKKRDMLTLEGKRSSFICAKSVKIEFWNGKRPACGDYRIRWNNSRTIETQEVKTGPALQLMVMLGAVLLFPRGMQPGLAWVSVVKLPVQSVVL